MGRLKASWAEGHVLSESLPEALPDWLYGVVPGSADHDRVVRHGTGRGGRIGVNWARTLTRWGRRGHADGSLVWRKRPYGPGRLVFLWDVSGSMSDYVPWFLPWLYRVRAERPLTHVFAFGTALIDLTPYMTPDYPEALRMLSGQSSGWGGGTAIGQVLTTWQNGVGRTLLGSGSTVVIISDGWDVGEPQQLERSLHVIAQRSKELIWINPLMVTHDFEPRTRALKVALQYVAEMTSGATIMDLRRLCWRLGLTA